MATWKMTIPGMYKYLKDNPLSEYELFDQLTLPDNLADYREKIIEQILFESAERPVMYEDVMYVRYHIGVWSRNNVTRFQKLAELYNLEFNPIENYDRIEESTTTGSFSNESSSNASSESESSSHTQNYVSAYDSDSMSEHDRSSVGNESSDSGTTSGNSTGENETHVTSHIHGNIGVTTGQQMWISQYDLLEQYTHVFDSIAKDFCRVFCLYAFS